MQCFLTTLDGICLVSDAVAGKGASLASYLSWIEGLQSIPLHEEHVYEVDEDARGVSGVLCGEGKPLVQYHKHQVAKQTQQEQKLRKKHQVQVVLLPKVPVYGDKNKRQAVRNCNNQ